MCYNNIVPREERNVSAFIEKIFLNFSALFC
ncbi:hypothetical protein YTXLTZUM_CDS0192 [Enterococcus phage VRE9_3]